jgi:hypothetical protein
MNVRNSSKLKTEIYPIFFFFVCEADRTMLLVFDQALKVHGYDHG